MVEWGGRDVYCARTRLESRNRERAYLFDQAAYGCNRKTMSLPAAVQPSDEYHSSKADDRSDTDSIYG